MKTTPRQTTTAATARRRNLLAALSSYDDGSGTLGIVVDQALRDDPEVTRAEIAAILDEAIADAATEATR